jgi:SH3 domain-containing protein
MREPDISIRRQEPAPPPTPTPPAGRDRGSPAAAATAAADGVSPSGWVCLRNCNLSGRTAQPVPIPFVLLHPEVGVALLELAPGTAADAEGVLRRRLEAARFDGIFPGHLPIVHLRVAREDLAALDSILHEAFAAVPPLSIPGGDAWMRVVERALSPRDVTRGASPATQPGGAAGEVGTAASPRSPGAEGAADRPAAPQMLRNPVVPSGAVAAVAAPAPAPGADAPPARPAGPGAPATRAPGSPGPDAPPQASPAPSGPAAADPISVRDEPAAGQQPRTAAASPGRPPGGGRGEARPWLWAGGGLVLGVAATVLGAALLRDAPTPPPAGPGPASPQVAGAPAPAPRPADPGTAEDPAERTAGRPQAVPAAGATGAPGLGPPAATGPAAAGPVGAAPRAWPPASEATAAAPAPRGVPAAPPTAPPPPAPAAEPVERTAVRTPANLRTAPDLGSRVVRTAPRGETFIVYGRAPGGWVQVGDEAASQGWIHSSLLVEAGQQ